MKEPNILLPRKKFINPKPVKISAFVDEVEMITELIERIGVIAFTQSFAKACGLLEKKGRLK